MSDRLLLTGGTLDGNVVDILTEADAIVAVGPDIDAPGAVVHDISGHVVLPGLVEPHAHLDKAFLADRVPNPAGDLAGAIEGLEAVRSTITHDDIVERACAAAAMMSRNGVTSVRTHADTTVGGGLIPVFALLEAKERCASFIDIQVAMLLEWPLTGPDAKERHELAREAVAAGVDVVGGCPHLDPDPAGALEWLLDLALETGLPLDLHADENLRTDSRDLERVADLVLSRRIDHPINASHCVSLSVLDADDVSRIADKVSRAGITVTALPQTNLFLQGRAHPVAVPRAIAPVATLRDAGVVVAAGADNLQDPFNPMGRADPLEIASLMVTAAHETVDHAAGLVTTGAARVVHRRAADVAVGSRADLVAVRASTVREAIATGPLDRFVVHGGVVVSDHTRNRK